jgi:hypothetical protein
MDAFDFNEPTAEEKAKIRRRKAQITRRIKKLVCAKYGIDRLPNLGERVLVTGGQGTGKSRTVIERIAEQKGDVSVWFMVPTLEKAEEQKAEYETVAKPTSLKAYVVRGRGAPDPHMENETMCPRHEVVNRAAAMGVKVQEEICDGGCPLRYTPCGFQRQAVILRERSVGLYLMASDYLWLPCPAPRADYIIADESVIQKASEIVSFDPARIMDDDKWSIPKDLDTSLELRGTALKVRDAITKAPGKELKFLRDHDVTMAELRDCVDHLRRKEEAVPDVSGHMTDREISDRLDIVDAREIMKVYKLFQQTVREFDQPRDRLNSVGYNPDYTTKVEGEVERQPRVFVSDVRRPRLRKEIAGLCLDGTGSLSLNQKIFGEHMTEARFAAPRDAVVYQVTNKAFSRQSITGTDRNGNPINAQKMHEAKELRAQIIEFLSLLPGKVLLVSYKAAIEALKDDLPEHVETAHFGALRGLNSFEHCETVVVMGRQQPSAQAIETMTRPYTATDAEPFIPFGEYVPQCRGLRLRDPEAQNLVEAQVHPDPRCQEILEQVREAEMVQAVDRVRPIFNHRRVFVLNSLPLDLTVDRVMTWLELRPSNFVRAFARFGVLPISIPDLFRLFNDLWPSRAAVGKALERLKTSDKTQIDTLFGKCRMFFPTVRKGTYRRKGAHGPLAGLLVRSDLPDPKAVLEGMVGEVTEFTIEQPPEPPAHAAEPPPQKATEPKPAMPRALDVLSYQGHMLATLDPYQRPPDMLGAHQLLALTGHVSPEVRKAA